MKKIARHKLRKLEYLAAFIYLLNMILLFSWRINLKHFILIAITASLLYAISFCQSLIIHTQHKTIDIINKKIHTNRHEYKNDLTIIAGLLELGNIQNALKYLHTKWHNSNEPPEPSVEEFFALLHHHCTLALLQGIDVSVKLTPPKMKVPSEFFVILDNLLENAREAILLQNRERWLKLNITSNNDFIQLTISNSGLPIATDLQTQIFEPGVTTKANSTHGFGLTLSKEKANLIGGNLALIQSDEDSTTFTFTLPAK